MCGCAQCSCLLLLTAALAEPPESPAEARRFLGDTPPPYRTALFLTPYQTVLFFKDVYWGLGDNICSVTLTAE